MLSRKFSIGVTTGGTATIGGMTIGGMTGVMTAVTAAIAIGAGTAIVRTTGDLAVVCR
jgi:hypothetical protein